jgi:hypothetical protein
MAQNSRKRVKFHGFRLKTKIRPGHRVVLTKIHSFFGFFGYSTVMHNAASDISENWLYRAFLGQNQALFGPENNPNIENKHFSRHVILNFICTDRLKQISAI